MTAPNVTPDDLAALVARARVRESHRPRYHAGKTAQTWCLHCSGDLPCDAIQLADAVEGLVKERDALYEVLNDDGILEDNEDCIVRARDAMRALNAEALWHEEHERWERERDILTAQVTDLTAALEGERALAEGAYAEVASLAAQLRTAEARDA